MTEGARERWLFDDEHPPLAEVDGAIAAHYLVDEATTVRELAARATLDPSLAARVQANARELVVAIRAGQRKAGGVDALLGEYDLSSREGVVLMCLAEALLRIPDAATADKLIADKLAGADWRAHLGASESLFVNASTWALLLTGRVLRAADVAEDTGTFLTRLVERLGEPVVRAALRQSMKILGAQFVMGETIDAALRRAARSPEYDYSFDMLGEAALTRADARRYLDAYRDSIAAIGRAPKSGFSAGISVKLSALEPRYERAQSPRALDLVAAALLDLAQAAHAADVALTIDAEEADRLDLSLAIFARVFRDAALAGYEGLGLAVQAYQKRAPHVLRWLETLARSAGRRIPVRLVKGAYWDSEIKRAQELGLDGYPVFTRKTSTDVSYLACARDLLTEHAHLLPQFATHNAHTVAWVLEVGARRPFEFQRLHGMGEDLYAALLARPGCRAALPRLRARRQPRAPAPVSREATARERREHVVRESTRARRRESRIDRRRPGRGDAQSRRCRAPADTAAARPVRAAAPQFAWHESRGRRRARPARRRARRDESRHVARRAANRRPRARGCAACDA